MRKKIWAHKARSFKDAERFDIAFWKRAGAEAKFSAAWEMVRDFYRIRGKRGYKLRLQRSIQNIERM